MNKLLELIIKKQVNILLINTFTDVKKYNKYILVYEVEKGRKLTKKEFQELKKAVKEYDKHD